MGSPADETATEATTASKQSHHTAPIAIYHAKLSHPHLIGDLVRKDTSFGYGEVKLSQLSALQHHTAKLEGNQVQLPKVPMIIGERDMGLCTQRPAVPVPQQPVADQSYGMAVFTWNGDALPPAKLVDATRRHLPARALHRGMIEKRVWAKKTPESDRHRWRWVGTSVYRTSDLSEEHIKEWAGSVSNELDAQGVAGLQESFQLRRLQVEVTSTTADLRSVNANEFLLVEDHDFAHNHQNGVSRAICGALISQRPTKGLIGDAVFDINAQNTITDKGLTLCFGTPEQPCYNVETAPQATQSHMPKLIFATGAVSDFLLARLPASQLVSIEQGSQAALDATHVIKSYLRGVVVAYIDKTGRDCVRAIVDIGESPAPMGTILVTGGDASLLGHPQVPLINVGSQAESSATKSSAIANIVSDVKFMPTPPPSSPVDKQVSTMIIPHLCVVKAASRNPDSMEWTDSVRNALHNCTSVAETILSMEVEQIVGKAGDWKLFLRGFVAEQESATKSDQYAMVLKAFCEINLGLNSFCVNEVTLQGAKADRRDTLRSLDAHATRTAHHFKARSKKRLLHQLPSHPPFGDHDRPMDLTVAVHLTLITLEKFAQHTHILLAVVSRDYALSKQYSTFIQLYEESDKVAMRVQLAQRLHDLSQRHAERWTSQKLTIIRSGDWLDDTRNELDQLMARFDDDARKGIDFSQLTVCNDSKLNGLIDADAVTSARDRETAALPHARSTGSFYLTQDDGSTAALKPALYVSQAQCGPQLKFIKAQVIRGSLGYSPHASEDGASTTDSTDAAIPTDPSPAAVASTFPPIATTAAASALSTGQIERLAYMWRDEALGLYTCKWPIPTYLVHCATDCALLHTKVCHPSGPIKSTITSFPPVSPTESESSKKSDGSASTCVSSSEAGQSAEVETVDSKGGTLKTVDHAKPTLVLLPVHERLRNTLYYL
ncbi:hypothetical protein B0A48_08701 [Cryoendolithus antarcticus]|uniref:Uncharacterized protein n=1 Tax=Cryoendolithus antarcticus TaxID=1507870 RepID=A0A1V8T3W8_9PEZI|nr:hypothetical protein B0A48_08701 [Cryoendolithus antarcticus]